MLWVNHWFLSFIFPFYCIFLGVLQGVQPMKCRELEDASRIHWSDHAGDSTFPHRGLICLKKEKCQSSYPYLIQLVPSLSKMILSLWSVRASFGGYTEQVSLSVWWTITTITTNNTITTILYSKNCNRDVLLMIGQFRWGKGECFLKGHSWAEWQKNKVSQAH